VNRRGESRLFLINRQILIADREDHDRDPFRLLLFVVVFVIVLVSQPAVREEETMTKTMTKTKIVSG